MLSLLSDPGQYLEQLTAAWLFFTIEALISLDSITPFLLVSTDPGQFLEQLVTELAARPYQVPLPRGPPRK